MREELPGLRPAVAMENGGNGEMTRSVLTLVMFATVSISAVTQSTAPDTVDEPRSGTPVPSLAHTAWRHDAALAHGHGDSAADTL